MARKRVCVAAALFGTLLTLAGCSAQDPFDIKNVGVQTAADAADPGALTITISGYTCRDLESAAELRGDEIRVTVKRTGDCHRSMNVVDSLARNVTAQSILRLPPGGYRLTVRGGSPQPFVYWKDGVSAEGASPQEAQSKHAVLVGLRDDTKELAARIERALPARKVVGCGPHVSGGYQDPIPTGLMSYSCRLQKDAPNEPLVRAVPPNTIENVLGCSLTPNANQIPGQETLGTFSCAASALGYPVFLYLIVSEQVVELVLTRVP